MATLAQHQPTEFSHWKDRLPGDGFDHIPGDGGWPIVGNTFTMLADPHAFARRMYANHGPVYKNRAFGGYAVTDDSGKVHEFTGKGAKARKRLLSGAIAVRPAAQPKVLKRNIILVDDVLTSGATTEACVKVLKQAGAARVVICCFARVLDEALDFGIRHGQNETPGTEGVPGAT